MVLIGIIIFAIIQFGINGVRSKSLMQQAQQNGFGYQRRVQARDFLRSHSNYHLYQKGHRRTVSNVMERYLGEALIQVFDYSYVVTHSTDSSNFGDSTVSQDRDTHYTQTICRVEDSELWLPEFRLRPEGFLESMFGSLWVRDIDFPSHRDFSNKYHLSGPDEGHIRQFFTHEVLSFLEANPGWYIEATRREFIVCAKSRKIGTQNIEGFIELGIQLRQHFLEAARA